MSVGSENGGRRIKKGQAIRVGYVPLVDAAPLVIAKELGFFEKYGVKVELSREMGWASVRDKILYGELEAAHAPAGLLFAIQLGLNSQPREVVAGLMINSHGNAITISKRLYERGVLNARGMGAKVALEQRMRRYTFGTVSMFSTHYYLLRQWLKLGGVNPDRDVRFVVIPPSLMPGNLREGNIDGFCAGEPWNSMAADEGSGVILETSKHLSPEHPEKVVMTSKDFVEGRRADYVGLCAAVLEGCRYCGEADHHKMVAEVLSGRRYLNVSKGLLEDSLSGRVRVAGGKAEGSAKLQEFYGDRTNAPTLDKAMWVWGTMEEGVVYPYLQRTEVEVMMRETFQMDLYYEVEALFTEKRGEVSVKRNCGTQPGSLANAC